MSLSISVGVKARPFDKAITRYRVQVVDNSDKAVGQLATRWFRETVIGWPVASPDGGFSRSSIEAPVKIAEGRWQFRITARYAPVIEYGGYIGVGPKTHERSAETLSGGIEINEGIYVIQRPSAPLRRALNTIKLELTQEAAPQILRASGFRGFGGGGTSTAFRGGVR